MPYTPTITTNTIPGIAVTMAGNVSYNEFLNSLGNWNYHVKEFYIKTISKDQLSQPIKYTIYDITGDELSKVINIELDPYQYQAAQMVDLKQLGILLNGQSSLTLDVLPGEVITIILYTNVIALGNVNMIQQSDKMEGNDILGQMFLYDTTRVYPIRGMPSKCKKAAS